MGWAITEVSIALIAFAAVSGRLRGSAFTPAILFAGVGFLLGNEVFDTMDAGIAVGDIRLLAELTLALVLFSDASSLDARRLSHEAGFPSRLLGIGLPLTIIFGAGVALWLFPDLLFFEAIVLAVLLAPTDAALGQTVVSDKRLPSRVRQGLNVESGLNDGVCVPLLFAAVAFAELEEAPTFEGEIIVDLVKEIGIATVVGLVVALAVGFVVAASKRRGWLDEAWARSCPSPQQQLRIRRPLSWAEAGFIAAFVAGLVYGRRLGAATTASTTRLMEEVGGVLSAVTFFVFGAILIGTGVKDLDLTTVVYAVLSLTAVRMVPVALSLIGSGRGSTHHGVHGMVRAARAGHHRVHAHDHRGVEPRRHRPHCSGRNDHRVVQRRCSWGERTVAHGTLRTLDVQQRPIVRATVGGRRSARHPGASEPVDAPSAGTALTGRSSGNSRASCRRSASIAAANSAMKIRRRPGNDGLGQ